jgi:hypothetical protein
MSTVTPVSPSASLDSVVEGLRALRPPDLLAEPLISMSRAAALIPPYRPGRGTSPSTIWRWITRGVALPDGTRLRLEAVRCGSRWLTSAAAIELFFRAQTAAARGEEAPAGAQRHNDRRQDQVERELEGMGL